jgi:hypothetical protein
MVTWRLARAAGAEWKARGAAREGSGQERPSAPSRERDAAAAAGAASAAGGAGRRAAARSRWRAWERERLIADIAIARGVRAVAEKGGEMRNAIAQRPAIECDPRQAAVDGLRFVGIRC